MRVGRGRDGVLLDGLGDLSWKRQRMYMFWEDPTDVDLDDFGLIGEGGLDL